MQQLCHVTTAAALAEAEGKLRATPFLHLCTEEQLPFVLARHFAGVAGLVVLRFDPALVEGEIVWESSEPGMDPFPHLYGALPITATHATPAGGEPLWSNSRSSAAAPRVP